MEMKRMHAHVYMDAFMAVMGYGRVSIQILDTGHWIIIWLCEIQGKMWSRQIIHSTRSGNKICAATARKDAAETRAQLHIKAEQ